MRKNRIISYALAVMAIYAVLVDLSGPYWPIIFVVWFIFIRFYFIDLLRRCCRHRVVCLNENFSDAIQWIGENLPPMDYRCDIKSMINESPFVVHFLYKRDAMVFKLMFG